MRVAGDAMSGQEGFTLMEMLVVVSIISVLAIAFGASFLGWREQYKAESDIKKIHAAFMDAKVNALKERRHVFIQIPPTASASNQVIRLYRDVHATDPLKPGNAILDTGTDEQVGPDIELNMRLVIIPERESYRKAWFNARGHMSHDDFADPAKREFDILLMQREEDEPADSDVNCLKVMPPLYVSGGFYNGASCEMR